MVSTGSGLGLGVVVGVMRYRLARCRSLHGDGEEGKEDGNVFPYTSQLLPGESELSRTRADDPVTIAMLA